MTFTFIELESADLSSYRTVYLRGGDAALMRATRLKRFMDKHGLHITAMWQVDQPDLGKAVDWLEQVCIIDRG